MVIPPSDYRVEHMGEVVVRKVLPSEVRLCQGVSNHLRSKVRHGHATKDLTYGGSNAATYVPPLGG